MRCRWNEVGERFLCLASARDRLEQLHERGTKDKTIRTDSFIVLVRMGCQKGSAEDARVPFRKVHLPFAFIVSAKSGRFEEHSPNLEWELILSIAVPNTRQQPAAMFYCL